MQPSNYNNEQGREELNGIQRQKNQRTDESLEATRRMVGLVAKSQQVGDNTMRDLDQDDEKLRRIESGLDNTHHEMNQAEKDLTNLRKRCGLRVLPGKRVRRKYRPMSNSTTTHSSEKSSPTTAKPKPCMAGEEGMPSSGYITRITNDEREVEMDDNLQIVSSYVGNLKNIALDMHDTLTNQNKRIDSISKKADAALERVAAANKQTQDIARHA